MNAEVIRHLAEIERRKLYVDLKYPSLFEYATRELGYCGPTAQRHIDAMRLMKEIPEVEAKIESGALTLSNISQAQIYFREMKRTESTRVVSRAEKAAVLEKLEFKSTREAERELLAISPPEKIRRERVRQIDLEHTEIRFTINAELKAKLQEVRSLMGPRGGALSVAELVAEMATVAAQHFAEKKFGKRRVQAEVSVTRDTKAANERQPVVTTTTQATARSADGGSEASVSMPVTFNVESKLSGAASRTRYIPQSVKHYVWRAAGGKCSCCGSKNNLQFDHVQPVALGGGSTANNLQLLCGSCNLRRGVKTFGVSAMRRG